ncbi:uncharacterized protein LOC119601060 [Lucilia sericata]|uniref:uncharacterized protein LOC119601060 n=1 Tax=Lucilia sericata TaxID=13632 RepID=UPI0018A7EFC4|nr:uncharacterized protein LOC119601060 [Lucilia sericata]
MSGFHPTDLIREVKARPGIYNKDFLDTPPREHKRRLWLEVAENLTPPEDWESYTDVEKEARVDEISTKWKHMKDHFYREIKLQEAGEAHKKRKYIYFDDMEFMRPFVGYKLPAQNRRRANNKSLESLDDLVSQDTDDLDMDEFLKSTDNLDSRPNSSQQKQLPRRSPLKRAAKPTPKALQNKSNIKPVNVIKKTPETTNNPSFKIRDGDISFCLSLVPTLRKLGDGRKLRAKIEILKVLHRYVEHLDRRNLLNRQNHNNSSQSANNIEDDMDEDHLEEYDDNIVKHEEHDDPLNGGARGGGGAAGGGNTKTWWT